MLLPSSQIELSVTQYLLNRIVNITKVESDKNVNATRRSFTGSYSKGCF